MKRKKVWRYYCEYCGKSAAAAGHMATHERGCTLNPGRKCRVCHTARDYMAITKLIPARDLLTSERHLAAMSPAERVALNEEYKVITCDISQAVNECPMCMFTVMRLSGVPMTLFFEFELRERLRAWHEANDERRGR